ncbi:MAG: PocR ligand-binding domain-containing protein [Lachnospiraceae bacterium]
MKHELFRLDKILNIEKWQRIQNDFANYTKMALITVDYKGVPVTTHSNCTRFCQQVRTTPSLRSLCEKCDSRGGLEAVRNNKPYIYLCHYNILDIAIPIIVDGNYIGALMAGQVRLSDSIEEHNLETIISTTKNLECDMYYNELPILPYDDIMKISDLLFNLCNYIISEAIDKNKICDLYDTLIDTSYSTKHLPHIASIESLSSNTFTKLDGISINSLLYPAIDYIYHHKNETVSLEKASTLCNISKSYFSRIFHKTTGTNYTTYIATKKIEWAKDLLRTTTLSIFEISEQLGFSDPGYFIKVFKKQEGITPAIFRKYND